MFDSMEFIEWNPLLLILLRIEQPPFPSIEYCNLVTLYCNATSSTNCLHFVIHLMDQRLPAWPGSVNYYPNGGSQQRPGRRQSSQPIKYWRSSVNHIKSVVFGIKATNKSNYVTTNTTEPSFLSVYKILTRWRSILNTYEPENQSHFDSRERRLFGPKFNSAIESVSA